VTDIQDTYVGKIGGTNNWQNVNIFEWSKSCYDIAITLYEGLSRGSEETVPQWYLDANIPVANTQIVLGGYRLAWLIQWIYPNTASESFLL